MRQGELSSDTLMSSRTTRSFVYPTDRTCIVWLILEASMFSPLTHSGGDFLFAEVVCDEVFSFAIDAMHMSRIACRTAIEAGDAGTIVNVVRKRPSTARRRGPISAEPSHADGAPHKVD